MKRHALLVAVSVVLVARALHGQANDTCATATPLTAGAAVVASSTGATTGPDPVGCNAGSDVWFTFVAGCSAQYTASTCATATTFDTVLAVWSGVAGCGALTPVGCNDNNCAIGGPFSASRVTFTAVAGTPYFVSVGGKLGATGTFSLLVSAAPTTTLTFSHLGPGTLGYQLTGPPNGAFFLGVTSSPGAFPFGWFYGLDMPLFDIVAQFNAGPPFVGAFSPCGIASFGPVGGAPSGLTLYAVAVTFLPGSSTPSAATNPATFTVL